MWAHVFGECSFQLFDVNELTSRYSYTHITHFIYI